MEWSVCLESMCNGLMSNLGETKDSEPATAQWATRLIKVLA